MPKLSSRILATLLMFCMLVDPSQAGAFALIRTSRHSLSQTSFSIEAFVNRDIETRGTFAIGLRAVQMRLERQAALQASAPPADPRAIRHRNRLLIAAFLILGITVGGALQGLDVARTMEFIPIVPAWGKWMSGGIVFAILIAADLFNMHSRIRDVRILSNVEFTRLAQEELRLLGPRLVSANIELRKRDTSIQEIAQNTVLFHPTKLYFSFIRKIYLWTIFSVMATLISNQLFDSLSTFRLVIGIVWPVLITAFAPLRFVHWHNSFSGSTDPETGRIVIHPDRLSSEFPARMTMTHEAVHAFKQKKIIRNDLVTSSAAVLRMTELIARETDAPVLSQKWRDRAEKTGFNEWEDLNEGYRWMRNILSRNEISAWQAINTLVQTRKTDDLAPTTTMENYSASIRVGGMAVALFKQYPPDPSDPTGGKPWAFLRALANGQSLSEALASIGVQRESAPQKPKGPIAHWDFDEPVAHSHDPYREPHFEQDQQQKLDEAVHFQDMLRRKTADRAAHIKAETERVQKAKADILDVLEFPLSSAFHGVDELDNILRHFLDIKKVVFIYGRETNSLYVPPADRPLPTPAEIDSLGVFLWEALEKYPDFIREIGDFSTHLKMLGDTLLDENHLLFVTDTVRRLIGPNARRQLISEAAAGVAIARHIRYNGMHFLSFGRPVDNDLLVETVRLFIPLLLALPEEQWEEEWVLAWDSLPRHLKFGDAMLWCLAEMLDIRLHDFSIYMFGDRSNAKKPKLIWPLGTEQAITEFLVRMLTNLEEVDAFGKKTGRSISPQKVGALLGKILRPGLRWPGLRPLGKAGDGAPGSMAYRLLCILKDDKRPLAHAFFNILLADYGDQQGSGRPDYADTYGELLVALKKFLLQTPQLHEIAQAA